jgi:ABC-type bacteriocin/lantibiotic exporter with double-glycine peptidase domain
LKKISIFLYEKEVTHQFDIENVYKLTEKNKPNYPTSNTLYYSIFMLVIIGTLAIFSYDLPWLTPIMIIVYIAWFIILWLDWLAELDYFTKIIRNWFKK